MNSCISITSLDKVIPVVPSRGAICNAQGCRELIRFSTYH